MNSDRLDSWKEISKYLKRDVRTCIRWKNLYSLPVHKIDDKSPYSRVFAYKSEIDQWLKEKSSHGFRHSLLANKWTYVVLASVLILFLLIYAYLYIENNSSSDSSTLAVIPIENLERSQHIDYLCKGIANEIVNRLIFIDDVKVIPIDNNNYDLLKSPKTNNKPYGADYLLKGTTIKNKDGISIFLRLIRTSDDSKLWEKRFDNPEKNISHIIENTYLKINEHLNNKNSNQPFLRNETNNNLYISHLKEDYIENIIKSGNNDPWKLYYKGKYLLGKSSPESNRIAINFFNQIIEIDNDFALSYIGLAQCYSNYVNFGWDFDKKWIDKAESLLSKAKSLAYNGPEFYSAAIEINLIKLMGFDGNNSDKINILAKQGIEKYNHHPQLNSIVGYWYFLKFGETGKILYFKKALEYKEKSFLLNPSSINNMVYAELLMLNKEYNKALDVCKITERNNSSALTKFRLGEIYYYMGDLNNSSFIFNQFEHSDLKLKIDSLFFLAMISSRLGEHNKAKKTIERISLLSPENTTHEDDLKLASIYFGLNNKELGYKHLIKHFESIDSKYNYHIDWKYTDIDQNFDSVKKEHKIKKIYDRFKDYSE